MNKNKRRLASLKHNNKIANNVPSRGYVFTFFTCTYAKDSFDTEWKMYMLTKDYKITYIKLNKNWERNPGDGIWVVTSKLFQYLENIKGIYGNPTKWGKLIMHLLTAKNLKIEDDLDKVKTFIEIARNGKLCNNSFPVNGKWSIPIKDVRGGYMIWEIWDNKAEPMEIIPLK